MRTYCAGRLRRGFTLIELLVVVAIIALLIAILLPSLGKARGNARTSACLANMHAVGKAALSYNSMYDGFMMPAQYSSAAGNASPVEFWETILIHDGFIPSADLATSAIAANVAGTTDASFHRRTAFHCPEDLLANYHRDAQATTSQWYQAGNPLVSVDSWYQLNAQGQQYSPSVPSGGAGNFTSGITPVYQMYSPDFAATAALTPNFAPKFASFQMPQGLILEVEAVGVNLRNMSASTPAPPAGIGVRWFAPHQEGKVTNLAFVDGHAARFNYSIYPSTSSTTPGLPVGGPLDKSGGKEIHWFSDKTY